MTEKIAKKLINKKSTKQTLVQRLVEQGMAADLKQASAFVLAGEVFVNDQKALHAGSFVSPEDRIRLVEKSRFVSRGGDKLWGAICEWNLEKEFKDRDILDVGSSTGGFTDCVLSLEARKVICVDAGSNQLAWKLRQDPRVQVFEKSDVRLMDWEFLGEEILDWVVMDVSFVSVISVLGSLFKRCPGLRKSFNALVLVKPQFELPPSDIPQGGVVVDRSAIESVASKVREWLEGHEAMRFLKVKDSVIKGHDGNQELFFYFRVEYNGAST